MCGRFTHYLPWSEIHRLYSLSFQADIGRNTQARYNIAPTQNVLFVHNDREHGGQVLSEGRWGLVPFWAKETPKAPMFNARSETVAEKSPFRDAFKSKRCLIPADGYYEWTKGADDGKDPWFLHLPDHKPFSFAGIWAHNAELGITSCSIITAEAVEAVRPVHDRMPVILAPSAYEEWLDAGTDVARSASLLKDHLDDQLTFYRVDRQVNTFRFQGEDAIRPLPLANLQ